jgi:glycosyltransferase involved in cell wall biosynthesis
MRVLYIGRGSSGHDTRFIDAWRAAGFETKALAAAGLADDELAGLLRQVAPDLVQVGPLTEPGARVARLWDGPLIATSWGFDLLQESVADLEARRQATDTLARADLVFVDNAAVRRAAGDLGALDERIVEFPWGLDPSWFAGTRTGRPPAESVFVSTRSHEPLYRVGDLLDAFLIVARDHPRVRLRLAGDGSLNADLRNQAELSHAVDRIEFVGVLSGSHLRAFYRDADLYVSTSSVDGTSVSLLEAMASRTPVLVSAIEGNAQWVTPATGLDYPVGEVPALAKLLSAFATPGSVEESHAATRAEAALGLVRDQADWPTTVGRFPDFASIAVARASERVRR